MSKSDLTKACSKTEKSRVLWTGPSVRANDIEGLLNSKEHKANVEAARRLVNANNQDS